MWSPTASVIRLPTRPPTIATGSSVSSHATQPEQVRAILDARRLEAGHDQRRLFLGRHDQHREPLERHRLVAGEARRSAPTDSSSASTPSSAMRARTRASRSLKTFTPRPLTATTASRYRLGASAASARAAGVVARPGRAASTRRGRNPSRCARYARARRTRRASTTAPPAGDARSGAGTGRCVAMSTPTARRSRDAPHHFVVASRPGPP